MKKTPEYFQETHAGDVRKPTARGPGGGRAPASGLAQMMALRGKWS